MANYSDQDAAIVAHTVALLALNEMLIDAGILEPESWPAQIRRWGGPDTDPKIQATVDAFVLALEERKFRSDLPHLSLAVDNTEEPK